MSPVGAPAAVGLAIPAYRDVDRLRRALASVVRVAPALLERALVVDDSGDGRVAAALAPEFPAVTWVVHPENRGFGHSATEAVVRCPADLVVLLNDDIELLTDPTEAVRGAFTDPALFAATFQSLDAHDAFREGAKRLRWPFGLPRILHNPADQRPAVAGRRPSDYAVGGHAAFHRERFARLGGFDPLFEPFYWEDVDLARRAAALGWSCCYLPECRVRHAGPSAIRTAHQAEAIRRITQRNRLLFAWRHLPARLRPLHPLALAWYRGSDPLFRAAYAEARERWRRSGQPRGGPASIADAASNTASTDSAGS